MNDENVTKKIQDRERPTDGIEFRIGTLEKHNQIRKISSTDGKTYFDTDKNVLVMEGGTITAGNIVGGIIKTSSSGQRIELLPDGTITIYDADSKKRLKLQGDQIEFFDENEVSRGALFSNVASAALISTKKFVSYEDIIAYQKVQGTIIEGAHSSSDGSAGATGSFYASDGVGGVNVIDVKDGLITSIV